MKEPSKEPEKEISFQELIEASSSMSKKLSYSSSGVHSSTSTVKTMEQLTDNQVDNYMRKKRVVSFKRKSSSSKYKGVLFVKSQQKWRAQICTKVVFNVSYIL